MKKSPLLIALTVFLLGIALLMVPAVGANSSLTQSQSYPDSVGIAPATPAGAPERVDLSLALESMAPISPAYGTEVVNNFFAQLDLTDSAVLTNVLDPHPAIFAADLAVDNSLVYAIVSNDPGADEFITFELGSPMTSTVIGSISPAAGEEWGGMAVTPDNTIYASSADCLTGRSTLYTINPVTGVATEVGEITGSPCISAIAADAGGMLWGVDNTNDNLVTINAGTGASTAVGNLGFNANFNQGLEYNENDNALYLAGFNLGVFQAQLHKLDTTNGSSVMTDTIGDSSPGGAVQMGWLGIESPTPIAIPVVPAITLDKTVGTDAASCATEDNIFVDEGDMVYYCYTVTNVGDITLTNHSLVDSELGSILSNEAVTLGVSASYWLTQTATITTTTVNTATWTATAGMSSTNAIDTAMVTVIPENGSAPDADIPDDNSTGVTDTISITETGVLTDLNVYLDVHHPKVGDLVVTLEHMESGMSVELVNRPEAMTTTRALAAPGDCDGDDIHNTLDSDVITPSIQTDCQGGDGMQAYMMGASYQPAGDLDDFADAGVPWAGTWEINVLDDAPTQEGTFVIWALEAGLGEPEIDVDPTSISDTLGLNDSSTHPLTITNSGDAVLAWEISSDVSWASVDTMSGTTAISDSSNLVVSFDSTGQTAGTYTGTLTIDTNDADEDPVIVELTLIVEATPADIEVAPTSLTSTQLTNEVTTQTLTISNTGDITLTWSLVISDAAWADVDMISGTTATGGSSDVIVSFDSAALAAGTYTGTLSIASNDPDESIVNVSLTLIVGGGPQPDIAVDPSSLASTLEVGDSEDQTLTISNNGDADLIWTIEEEAVGLMQPYRAMNTSKLEANTEVGEPTGNNSFSASGTTNVESFGQQPLNRDGDIWITHSTSQDVVAGSIACNDSATGFQSDNSYIRVFNMDDFGLGDFNITTVEFGVQAATSGTGSQPVEVNLYTLDGVLSFGNMTLIGRAVVDLEDQALTIASVDVTGFVPDGSILVVEVFVPNGVSDGNNFFIGSNADGQTAPSYLASVGCDILVPTDIADIGFPDMQIVMNVTGVVDGDGPFCTPTDLGWVSLDSMGATTAASDSDDVTVTFDATGLAAGNYDGNLCVGSNDPAKPIVIVPVSLTVQEGEPVPANCSAPNAAIPDNDPLGLSDLITLTDTGSIADVDIYLQTSHTWVGDLIYTVEHVETGTSVTIVDRPGYVDSGFGCGTDDIDATLDDEAATAVEDECAADAPAINGSFIPNNPLAAFDGEAIAGTWQITVSDNAGGDTGSLVQWCVNTEVQLPAPEIEVLSTELTSTQLVDTEVDETLTISNNGDAELTWDVTIDVDWASVDMANGSTAAGENSDVTVTFDSTGLAAGTYTGTLSIASNDPDQPVVEVTLTLIVEPPTAVEMAELATSSNSNVPLALAVAGMMLVLAGGFVLRRRRTQ